MTSSRTQGPMLPANTCGHRRSKNTALERIEKKYSSNNRHSPLVKALDSGWFMAVKSFATAIRLPLPTHTAFVMVWKAQVKSVSSSSSWADLAKLCLNRSPCFFSTGIKTENYCQRKDKKLVVVLRVDRKAVVGVLDELFTRDKEEVRQDSHFNFDCIDSRGWKKSREMDISIEGSKEKKLITIHVSRT